MSTPIKQETSRSYSLRNTPSRNTGEGAYEKYLLLIKKQQNSILFLTKIF